MEVKIKNCPFCGCPGKLRPLDNNDLAYVRCINELCNARGPEVGINEKAIEYWNIRN